MAAPARSDVRTVAGRCEAIDQPQTFWTPWPARGSPTATVR